MQTKKTSLVTNCINNISLFKLLDAKQRDYVFNFVKHKKFLKGETIYSPGENADALYILSSGKVRIFRLAENGKEQLIRILIPGEFTGELALFKRGIYEAFAEALEDTFICMIKHQDFKKLLLTYPLISTTMLEELANRLAISEEQTAWVATETVKDRLIHYLSRSASFDSDGNSFFDLNMSKKDLASYLGTTPESLSREWTNLELLGTIRQIDRKKVQLHGLGLNIKSCVITNH